jgi:hypothetical protein
MTNSNDVNKPRASRSGKEEWEKPSVRRLQANRAENTTGKHTTDGTHHHVFSAYS